MGLFGNKKEGGLMDVIRCDEQEYLIWKWRPSGEATSTKKENAIRYGSSLRVKDGEVAVFVYKHCLPRNPYIKIFLTPLLVSPINIIGCLLGKILPNNGNYYHNNIMIAVKK